MFAYCSNNPIILLDPSGNVAVCFFADSFMGDGKKRNYNNNSRFARALKKSTAILNVLEERIQAIEAAGAERTYCKSSTSVYAENTLNDKDLALTVGKAEYTMLLSRETRTTGALWWKKEQTRYVAEITMWDSYDFTEWFPGYSFGAIMNNIAAVGQFLGIIVPYDWEVSFTIKTKWE